jgi:hypothetical protein
VTPQAVVVLAVTFAASGSPEVAPERVILLEGETHHVQGILVAGDRLFLTSVDRAARKGYLFEYALPSGKQLRAIEIQDGDRFHPGGLDADARSLWIPVAEYRRSSTAVIQKRNRKTLELEASFRVADHIGCVAVGKSRIFGGNWDSKQIYEWTRDGRELSKRDNPSAVRFQDMKFRNGRIVASGISGPGTGAIEFLDPITLAARAARIDLGKTDRGVVFTNEGMDWAKDRFYLLAEDTPSRLFVFKAPSGRR